MAKSIGQVYNCVTYTALAMLQKRTWWDSMMGYADGSHNGKTQRVSNPFSQ